MIPLRSEIYVIFIKSFRFPCIIILELYNTVGENIQLHVF